VEQDVTPPTIDLGPDRFLTCEEPEITLSGTPCDHCGPLTYVWTDACGMTLATSPDLVVSLPGDYTVTVTGQNGCSASDTVLVANGVAPPTVEVVPSVQTVCCGNDVILEATASGGTTPYRYEWRDACDVIIGTDATVTITQPGTYLLIVRTADGCIGSDQVTVTEP
jgi:hypothetical protein